MLILISFFSIGESTVSKYIETDIDFNLDYLTSAASRLFASLSGNVTNIPLADNYIESAPTFMGQTQQAAWAMSAR